MSAKWSTRFELKPGVWVFVPTAETIERGAELKRVLPKLWRIPRNYFHLRSGGHMAALRSHAGSSVFAHLDIKNFFSSINRTRVTRSLKRFFGYEDARWWANESSVLAPNEEIRRYMLPFGFVQSPILASLCLYDSALGKVIRTVQEELGVTVSVYVDDIIVSATDVTTLHGAIARIKLAAERSNFTLNDDKEEGPAAQVTAFNITLSSTGLAIEESRMSEFVEAYAKAGSEEQRRGIFGYVDSVNPIQTGQL